LSLACSEEGNQDIVDQICEQYDFSDLDNLRLFVNGTWFDELEPLYNLGLSSQDVSNLYNTEITNSFGSYLQ
jgi:hypothetical protein